MQTTTLTVWHTPTAVVDRFLPEGPRLTATEDELVWVNIQESPQATTGAIFFKHFATGIVRKYPLPGRPGFVLPTTTPHQFLVGIDKTLAWFNSQTQTVTPFATIPDEHPRTIINDAEPTPDGQGIIFGTKDTAFREPIAHLYHWAVGQDVKMIRAGQTCSNGKVFSADGRTLYDIDTPTKTVVRYAWDAITRTLGEPEIVIDLRDRQDYPDGMIDGGQGTVIVAFYHPGTPAQGELVRFHLTSGKAQERWLLPGSPRVTCPCLVPHAGEVLLIATTADESMSPEQRQAYPQAGCLFWAHVPQATFILTPLINMPAT